MSLSTDPGREASSTSNRCCRLLADAGFSHIPASKRDVVMLETCKPKDNLKDASYLTQSQKFCVSMYPRCFIDPLCHDTRGAISHTPVPQQQQTCNKKAAQAQCLAGYDNTKHSTRTGTADFAWLEAFR